MPYLTVVLNELSALGHTLDVFYLDKEKQTPYNTQSIEKVSYHKVSEFSKTELLQKVAHINPDLLVVCGWNNLKYNYVARSFKKSTTIPVVCPIDTQYIGRLKQTLGFIFSPLFIKQLFTHIWVPGVRQYHFARMLGYKPKQIIMNSLTGNVDMFRTANIEQKRNSYPKTLLFVGRYHPVKGLDCLLKAWDMIPDKKGWSLTFVGNGPLKKDFVSHNDITVLDFTDQRGLVSLSETQGVFILPSLYEPWALVLQEFAAAGMPIICSDACGAADHYVIHGYNGYRFNTGSIISLKDAIERVINLSSEELMIMSERSRMLSNYTNPEKSAYSLLSVVNRD